MAFNEAIIQQLAHLRSFSREWGESAEHLTAKGFLSRESLSALAGCLQAYQDGQLPTPNLQIGDNSSDLNDIEELQSTTVDVSSEWKLTLSKSRLRINSTLVLNCIEI